jgi:hypothetical protein
MAQILAKDYECLTCHEPIKIAKLDNVPPGQKRKWERFQLDGVTPHQCKKKEEEAAGTAATTSTTQAAAVSQVDNGPQIAALADQLKDLKETVNVLISQIQMLRSDLKKGKCISE